MTIGFPWKSQRCRGTWSPGKQQQPSRAHPEKNRNRPLFLMSNCASVVRSLAREGTGFVAPAREGSDFPGHGICPSPGMGPVHAAREAAAGRQGGGAVPTLGPRGRRLSPAHTNQCQAQHEGGGMSHRTCEERSGTGKGKGRHTEAANMALVSMWVPVHLRLF